MADRIELVSDPKRDRRTLSCRRFSNLPYGQIALALLLGVVLRLFFIVRFPFYSGDTKFYEEIARNWLYHGVYGLYVNGQLMPVDMRVPGYPAFLAAIYALFGRTRTSVMLVQVVVDLITCVLASLLAAQLSPARWRNKAALFALWLAALCPFTAMQTSVPQTEILATFLTTLALFVLVKTFASVFLRSGPAPDTLNTLRVLGKSFSSRDERSALSQAASWLLAGVVVGLGTLVRPETPLILAAAGMVLASRWWRRADWSKLLLAGSWMAVGLVFVLLPWGVRNARTLGRIQSLSGRYAESYGDFIPRGFFAWTQTWMVRYEDAYLVPWRLGNARIDISTLPDSAFDSKSERAEVAALLDRYNSDLQMAPMLDRTFAKLAGERARRHPLRTYIFIPLARAAVIWFGPRVETLRYLGDLWPPVIQWRGNPIEFDVTLGLSILTFVYIGLAIVGAWRWRADPGVALIAVFVLIRTAMLTQLQTVEPRYVIECFPALMAFAALAWCESGSIATQRSFVDANEKNTFGPVGIQNVAAGQFGETKRQV